MPIEALHLAQLHAAVFRFPAVVRLLGDAVGSTQVCDLPAAFAFLDDRQDLLAGVFAPFHSVLLGAEDLISPVADQRGQVTCAQSTGKGLGTGRVLPGERFDPCPPSRADAQSSPNKGVICAVAGGTGAENGRLC